MYLTKEILINEKDYQRNLLEHFEKTIKKLPTGSLSLKYINGKNYIYHQKYAKKDKNFNHGQPQKYEIARKCLSSQDNILIEGVRRRRFMEKSAPILQKNLMLLDHMIAKYEAYNPDEICSKMKPVYRSLEVSEFMQEVDKKAYDWLQSDGMQGEMYPETLRHTTASMKKVRSKSEAIIADLLDAYDISYKYEECLIIGNQKFYPDFTIVRKRDNKIIYWEHFGMLHDENYRKKMNVKLKAYGEAGIVPWDNLIITADSFEGNIDGMTIKNIIKAMLLVA